MFTFENHRLVPKPWRHRKICNQANQGQPGLKVELNANVFPVVRVLCFWQLLLFRRATFFVSSSILHSEQFRRYRSSFKCLNWSCFHISLRRSRQVLSLVPSRPRRFRMWRHLSSSPIALGSKPPLVIRIARTCLGTRLQFSLFSETTYPRDHHSRTLIFSHFKPIVFFFRMSAQRARSTEHLKLKWMDRPYNIKTTSSSLTMLFGGNV